MILSSLLSLVLLRIGFLAALALLAGCATTSKRTAVEVSSPPPPTSGTQRIVAYDAYAAALFVPASVPATVAVSDSEKHTVNSTLD